MYTKNQLQKRLVAFRLFAKAVVQLDTATCPERLRWHKCFETDFPLHVGYL